MNWKAILKTTGAIAAAIALPAAGEKVSPDVAKAAAVVVAVSALFSEKPTAKKKE